MSSHRGRSASAVSSSWKYRPFCHKYHRGPSTLPSFLLGNCSPSKNDSCGSLRITTALHYTSEKKPPRGADRALSFKNSNSLRAAAAGPPLPAFRVRTRFEEPPFFRPLEPPRPSSGTGERPSNSAVGLVRECRWSEICRPALPIAADTDKT